MKHFYLIVSTVATLFALAASTRAQTFDDFDSTANNYVEALAVQPDGKIWIGGAFTTLDGQTNQGLARVRADGSLDLTFNPGAATQDYSLPEVIGVVVQPDGKVVGGGWFSSFAGSAHTNIVRLNADGTVDGTFNPTFVHDLVVGLAMQSDGKILAAAGTNVFRINTDGTRDTGFNVSVQGSLNAVAVQPDGKILVAGFFTTINGQTNRELARVNSNGTVDTSFNYSLTSVFYLNVSSVRAVTVQPDGKILVLGNAYYFEHGAYTLEPGLFRLTSDGAQDTGSNSSIYAYGLVLTLQSDGKILIEGVSRLNTDLTLDTTFTNAWVSASSPVMALQADGRLLRANGGQVRRLNVIAPVTQDLSISGSTITWLRGGASPEVWRTTFEYSTDHGSNWVSVGAGTRISGGWQKTGAAVPANANIRARGFIVAGDSSSWFVESGIGPVLITGQPDSRTNNAGTVANFFVTAGGTSLSYQWLKNGTNVADGGSVSGAQTSALTLTNVLNADVAAYSVIISNSFGSITSQVANLTILVPFTAIQPTNTLVMGAGQTAVLTVTTAAASPTYRWLKDGVNISDSGNVSGTTTATLIITNLNGGNAGNYRVTVSNLFGTATSAVRTLSVIDPFIVASPSDLWVNSGQTGQTAIFGATAAGTALNYQWMKNDTNILAGETNATLTITNVQFANGGNYRLAVSGTYGTNTSAAATLIVTITTPTPFENAVLNPTNGQFYSDSIDSARFQPDGKILVAGQFTLLGANGNWFGRTNIGRLNADGTVDLSFNPPAPNTDAGSTVVSCLAEQTDGKVLIGGHFFSLDGTPRYCIARLNPNGSLDNTFQNGMMGIGLGRVNSIAVDTNGKILIGGNFGYVNDGDRNSIARLNADGSLDTGFQNGMDGVINAYGYSGEVTSIVLQPDGKVIIGGGFVSVNGVARNGIARLNTDGSLDTNFQDDGLEKFVNSMILQADGKILIGGWFETVGGVWSNGIHRLNSDGTLDSLFYPFGEPSPDIDLPGRLALQTDGKIVGLYANLSTGRSGTMRITANGALDPSFSLNAYNPTETILSENGQILITTSLGAIINGQPRSGVCLLNNDPATQNLACTSSTATWLRGGTSPEVYRTTFELSTNSGTTWSSLGDGARISGGWQFTNLFNIPTNSGSMLRARGFASTGDWFVEHLLNLDSGAPSILVNDGGFGISANQFGFNFTGNSNQAVVIEGSTNLLNWLPLTTNTLGLAPGHFSDPNWTNFPKRFYRARLQ